MFITVFSVSKEQRHATIWSLWTGHRLTRLYYYYIVIT